MSEFVLKVSQLTKRFGGLVALDTINIDIKPGEIVGIIGPNGAGKTTFFNVVTGFYPPTNGTVELNGIDINGFKPHEVAALGFGRTFQNIRLFPKMTVLENVLMARTNKNKVSIFDIIFNTKKNVAEKVEAYEYAEKVLTKMNMHHARFQLASNLPYGYQRKLEIARALAIEPKLLLLDEPAAGMNENETMELLKIIKELTNQGYTILLIEHDMKFVMNICERIYVLDHGKQIAHGTPKEIKANPVVIEAYLGKEG